MLESLQVDRLVVGGESGEWMLGLFWKEGAQHGERFCCCRVVLSGVCCPWVVLDAGSVARCCFLVFLDFFVEIEFVCRLG